VRDQLILGSNGPIGINHLAIHEAMRLYGIRDKRNCFEKVLRLSGHFIEKAIAENENR
jgi:hypothetical protein